MNIRLILGALLGAALLSGMALVAPLAREARGDFILVNDQQLTVNTGHFQGFLYDTSQAFIVSGGSVSYLDTYDTSTVDISGGAAESVYSLHAYNRSTVHISGGLVYNLFAYDNSTVDISGGSVRTLNAYDSSAVKLSGGLVTYLDTRDSSTVDISGGLMIHDGSVTALRAYGTSVVTFHTRDFHTHGELWLDGDRVLGTGFLSGKWFDGTSWGVTITDNAVGATILAIPEPATLSLLALGGAALVRRRRK